MPLLTLTPASTPINLYTALLAVNSGIAKSCHQLICTANVGNGAANIYIGGSSVSSSQYDQQLSTGASVNLVADFNGVQVDSWYVWTDTNDAQLNVLVETI